jgi:dephospho-CoA kinase
MLVVGLTGGIGSGKSTAAGLFAELGAAVTDTDIIARMLTEPDHPLVEVIASAFGTQYLTPDGALDRAALRRLVFNDAAAKQTLENILHPPIREAVAAELEQPTSAPYRIVVVPLLYETGAYADLVQRTLVVDCPEQLQIQRTMARSALTETEVRAMMAQQLPRALRLARADDVIVNDSDLENLAAQVREMHKKYIRLA